VPDAHPQHAGGPTSAPPAQYPDYPAPPGGPGNWSPPPRRRSFVKPLLVAGAIGITLGLAATLGLLAVKNRQDPESKPRASGTPAPSVTPGGITLTKDGAPRNLAIDDRGTSVILNWVDTTEGRAPFIIFSARSGQPTKAVGKELQGQSSSVVNGLNPKADYCFVVAAAVSVDVLANSDSVCTARLGANASPPAPTPS
jgi:hypothetical protein